MIKKLKRLQHFKDIGIQIQFLNDRMENQIYEIEIAIKKILLAQ